MVERGVKFYASCLSPCRNLVKSLLEDVKDLSCRTDLTGSPPRP